MTGNIAGTIFRVKEEYKEKSLVGTIRRQLEMNTVAHFSVPY